METQSAGTPSVSIRYALRRTLTLPRLALFAIAMPVLAFIPYVGVWVSLVVLGGFYLTYQRRVRLGPEGLPELSEVGQWLRRGFGVIAIVFALFIPLLILVALVGIAVLRTGLPPASAAAVIAAALMVIPLEVLSIRYAVYDKLSSALQPARAFGAIRPHWSSFLRVLAWVVVAASTIFAIRAVGSAVFHVSLTPSSRLVAAALASSSSVTWLAVVAGYGIAVVAFVNGVIVANLLGQLASIAYPVGADGVPAGDSPAQQTYRADAPKLEST